uniref:Uncharacterized protein n=1 Tax=Globodera rostochiensis TaxID=31243 RepID=A0A914GRY8_GLORO
MIAVVMLIVISWTEEAEGLKCPKQFIWDNETRPAELAKYADIIKKDWNLTEKNFDSKPVVCEKGENHCVTFYCIDEKNHAMWAAFICTEYKREKGKCRESDLKHCPESLGNSTCTSCAHGDNCNQRLIDAMKPTTTTTTTTTTIATTTTPTPSVEMSTAGGEVSARLSAIPVLLLFGGMLLFHLLV